MARKKINLNRRHLFFFFLPLGLVLAGLVLVVSSRDFLAKKPCGCGPLATDSTGEFDPSEAKAFFDNQPVAYPLAQLKPGLGEGEKTVLGVADDYRWVEIDLSEQKLYARNGNQIDYEFLISSGKPWTPTVTGEFRVWTKIRYAKMSGGSRANGTYYYLPNVPFIQYYHKDYGLHGAYWHNNFGHTMSHGCVNLSIPDAEKLFYWTSPSMPEGKNIVYPTKDNPGTRIVIHE